MLESQCAPPRVHISEKLKSQVEMGLKPRLSDKRCRGLINGAKHLPLHYYIVVIITRMVSRAICMLLKILITILNSDLVVKTPPETPASHVRVPEFESQLHS